MVKNQKPLMGLFCLLSEDELMYKEYISYNDSRIK